MTYNMRMKSYSSMLEEYENLEDETPNIEPRIAAQISVRLAFLKPTEKTDLNLAAFYSLSGQTDVVSVVIEIDHPMKDLFTNRGEPKDKAIVQYVRNHLEKQRIAQEILWLKAFRI